jgi:hypothetical protein
MKNKKCHTVGTVPKCHTVGTVQKCHTVRTVPKSNEKQKYHTVGTVPKSNIKIVERGQLDTSTTHIHDRSLSWYRLFNEKWRS